MTARDVHALTGNFKSLKIQDVKPFGKIEGIEIADCELLFTPHHPPTPSHTPVHANGTRENCVSLTGTIPVQIMDKQRQVSV